MRLWAASKRAALIVAIVVGSISLGQIGLGSGTQGVLPPSSEQSGFDPISAAGAGGESDLERIAASCAASVGDDGFGSATVEGNLIISNEDAEIAVPCHIQLVTGGNLTLNNVRLRSRHPLCQ